MIIGIDGNEANLETRVGVGQYAFNIIKSLYAIDQTNQYYIYLKSPPLPDMPPTRSNWHYRVFGPSKLWTKLALPFHLYFDGLKLDLFYSPSHYSPHFSPFPTIPTIHDLGYLQTPDQFTKKDFYQLSEWTKRSIYQAKKIVTVSQFTKDELVKTYHINPDIISIAYNGVNQLPQIPENISLNILKKFNITKPYFLYLGTLKPNKNIPFLITAFAAFLKLQNTTAPSYQLVIAGKKGWLFDEIFQTVKTEKIENSTIFTDYISETEKWSLYKHAQATVIPSTYEGFGIPAIESQKAGTPVISSNIPVFTEVLQKSTLSINPTDISSLTDALNKITNPLIRSKFVSLGSHQSDKFTWTNSARSLIKIFSTI